MFKQYQVEPHLDIYDFKKFKVETLRINSEVLKKNPLRDPHVRTNPVMVPKGAAPKKGYPVVVMLAGFAGNGPKYFSPKTFEDNAPEMLDDCFHRGEAPAAIYVFVDAMTFWGGSQYINSKGTGRYEDYVIKEIVPAIKQSYPVRETAKHWCVAGGSSGGYGALHLASKYPDIFGIAAAIAPDSFFEASLLPEIRKVLPLYNQLNGLKGAKRELKEGKLLRRKSSFDLLNVIGMGVCYAPLSKGGIALPVDKNTGKLLTAAWKKWEAHDPLVFLKQRSRNIKKLHKIYLDVGDKDQFHLQYGARQIRDILKRQKAPLVYSEFSGTHWDIGIRRPRVWGWLNKIWR